MKIASSQYNFLYGDQLHYPYSIGCLLAYLSTQMDDVDVLPTAVLRDDLDAHVDRATTADVLLCSCYVWNWEITMEFARRVRTQNPDIFIVCGGPQVPDRTEGFFQRYPFIDALVHGEGEHTLAALLMRWRGGQDLRAPGVSAPTGSGGPASRILDLAALPSPYTSGMMERLIAGTRGVQWTASWETNRGCPYQCTFCDWGSATYTKLRQYPMDRLLGEVDWFAQHRIGYIDCCDANFGILPRDLSLARALKVTKAREGYPGTFRQSWAKNSSEKVIEIAKELQAGGLLTAVGLAVQSLDERTLEIIKRKNLPFDRLSDLSAQFARAGLPTYTEVIRGLPGETLETFKAGLAQLAADSHIGNIAVYHCGVLPNAPMADPEYRRVHQIETVRSPIFLAHASITSRDVPEYEEIVVSTATMSREDMLEAFLFSWAVLIGESLGLFNRLREAYTANGLMTPVEFYERIVDAMREDDGPFGQEYRVAADYAHRGYRGEGWTHHDPVWGDINWPIEEASWLRLVSQRDFVRHLADLLVTLNLWSGLSWPAWKMAEIQARQLRRPEGTDLPAWARETVWYGRRRRAFLQEAVTN